MKLVNQSQCPMTPTFRVGRVRVTEILTDLFIFSGKTLKFYGWFPDGKNTGVFALIQMVLGGFWLTC